MKAKLRGNPELFAQTKFEFELVQGNVVAPGFEWEEENEEFRYNGSMYDVIHAEVAGNILHVRCVDDAKETDILKQIEYLQEKTHRNKKSWPLQFQKLLSVLLFCPDTEGSVTKPASLHHQDHYREKAPLVILDILSPPPRRVNSFC
ncbi:MAG TPA: hypothetical protein VFI06_09640 [Chitinophagaceae bacterium]|nr:hypothetical protein [Chitinophagaceae bacterium]